MLLSGRPRACAACSLSSFHLSFLHRACCRLGSEANVLRGEQRDIAAAAAARRAARDAYRLSLERTADFRRMCSGKGLPLRASKGHNRGSAAKRRCMPQCLAALCRRLGSPWAVCSCAPLQAAACREAPNQPPCCTPAPAGRHTDVRAGGHAGHGHLPTPLPRPAGSCHRLLWQPICGDGGAVGPVGRMASRRGDCLPCAGRGRRAAGAGSVAGGSLAAVPKRAHEVSSEAPCHGMHAWTACLGRTCLLLPWVHENSPRVGLMFCVGTAPPTHAR